MLKSFLVPLQLVCQLVKPGHNIEGGSIVNDVATSQKTTDIPAGFTAFPEIGTAYRYFDTSVTWNAARETCIAYDSSLAVIDSFKKISLVDSLRKNPPYGAWIGMHRFFDDVNWVNMKTGLRVPVIPWAPENDASNKTFKCTLFPKIATGIYADNCELKAGILCEFTLSKDG